MRPPARRAPPRRASSPAATQRALPEQAAEPVALAAPLGQPEPAQLQEHSLARAPAAPAFSQARAAAQRRDWRYHRGRWRRRRNHRYFGRWRGAGATGASAGAAGGAAVSESGASDSDSSFFFRLRAAFCLVETSTCGAVSTAVPPPAVLNHSRTDSASPSGRVLM